MLSYSLFARLVASYAYKIAAPPALAAELLIAHKIPPLVPLAEMTGDAPGKPKMLLAVDAAGVKIMPLESAHMVG